MKSDISVSSRRRTLGAIAGFVSAVAAFPFEADSQQRVTHRSPSANDHALRTSLHQQVELPAPPLRVFEVLMNEKDFAALTGLSAKIDPAVGGAFKTFGGLIEGRNVELIPAQRIVQAWREVSWESGFYSLVHFELTEKDKETTLVLDHTGFHVGDFGHLDPGWHQRYWEPLKLYLLRPQSPR